MDNAAEALYMGAAVLVFMVALSLTLSSFSIFRNDLEDLILADEKVDIAQSTDSTGKKSYINYISSSEECRTVGIETVANSLYRVYKENYMVVIRLGKLNENNSTEYSKFGIGKDLEKYSNLIKVVDKEQIYKNSKGEITILKNGDTILVFNIPNAQNDPDYFSKALDAGLYNLLKDKSFTEYTGVYYETDIDDGTTSLDGVPRTSISVANKDKARIITYIENKK